MQLSNALMVGARDGRKKKATLPVQFTLILIFLCAGWLVAGCHTAAYPTQPVSEPAPAQNPSPAPKPSPDLQKKIETLHGDLASHKAQVEQLKVDNASLKIQILEYAALIQDLQGRSNSQRQRLDAAIVEVVRSKARLRSLESKAEAASTIAEAEIAISGLKKQIVLDDTDAHEEVSKTDQLVRMSVLEFKARNFGGALYLASQAKTQAQALQLGYQREKAAGQEDETPFAQPLPLTCLKNSNLREGPGLDKKIIDVLAKGTRVMGHAYKEGWVRVEALDGRSGWLSQSLISTR